MKNRHVYAIVIGAGAGGGVVAKELASKIKREIQSSSRQELEDPSNYLYLKTERGLTNLNKKDAVIEKIRYLKGNKEIDL